MKPYYERAGICLIHADCRDVLPTLEKVDAVITDPPYGIARVWKGGGSCGWGKTKADTESRNEWDDKPPSKELLDAILALNAPTVIWGGNYFDLPTSRGWLVWSKPERDFTLAEAELAWTNVDTVIRVCDYRRSDPNRIHPTQKPVGVMKWSLDRLKVPVGGIAFDPFAGVATTGIAAWQVGCECILVEISERYCEIGAKRLDAEISRGRLFTPEPEPIEQSALDFTE